MISLHVNIDHVATIRQARRGKDPEPIAAAKIAELAGADGITVHLRKDRRHIQPRDVKILKEVVQTHFNLEMSIADEIVQFAAKLVPEQCTLVPEQREELTTEGGLDVAGNTETITTVVSMLKDKGITVSLFIDPEEAQIKAAKKAGADFIELHTGMYANAMTETDKEARHKELQHAAQIAERFGVRVNAGHGLHYTNTLAVCAIPQIEQLHIGHSIVSRAVLVGLDAAVKEMAQIVKTGMLI